MTYGPKDMYWIAHAIALEKGPRVIIFGGKQYAAFALERAEVEEIFEDNHYKLKRRTWRDALAEWPRYGAEVSKKAFDSNYKGNWYVMFHNIDKSHFADLQLKSNNEGCYHYPQLAEGVRVE